MNNEVKLREGKLKISEKVSSLKSVNLKKYKKNIFILISLVIMLSFLFYILKDKPIVKDFSAQIEDRIKSFGIGSGFPYEIEGHKLFFDNTAIINGNIMILSDTLVESITPSSKKISSRPHDFSNPAMKSCTNKAIVYGIGGYNYRIETCSKIILEKKLDSKIICGSIAKNGVHALITESTSYLSEMIITNRSGDNIYKYSFSDCYICGIDLNNSGRNAVACGLLCLNGEMKSKVYTFRFNSIDPDYVYEFSDNMLTYAKYLSQKNILVVGDKAIYTIDTASKKIKEFSYKSKSLKCIDSNNTFGVVYCLSSSNNEKGCSLVAIDKFGNIKFEKEIGQSLSCVCYNNSKILGIENEHLFVYDISGELCETVDIGSNSSKILALSSSKILIFDSEKIKEINIK